MTHPEIYDDGYSLEYTGQENIFDFTGMNEVKVLQRKCEKWMPSDGECMNYAMWYAEQQNLEIVKCYLKISQDLGTFHFINRDSKTGKYLDFSPCVTKRKYFIEETA